MLLDPRGPRFGAWVTSAVLLAVLITSAISTTAAGTLALAQAAVFAIGAAWPRRAPYPLIFRLLVVRRLSPPSYLEPAAPVRFAQGVGFGFAIVAAAGYLAGLPALGALATAAALAAAFLNAAFGLCLACKVYPFVSLYVIRRRVSVDAGSSPFRAMPSAREPDTEGAHP